MWTYVQKTGRLHHDGQLVATGYSGFKLGRNNPDMERERGVGPIPCGRYKIGTACKHDGLGPCVMALTPEDGEDIFGRSGFFIHGDSSSHPGEASHGCIIFGPATRSKIAASKDRELTVVRE
jgi:hypothetical protein